MEVSKGDALDVGTGEVREQILFRAMIQAGHQGQPAWLPEGQALLGQPDLLLGAGDLIQWVRSRLWVLTTWI